MFDLMVCEAALEQWQDLDQALIEKQEEFQDAWLGLSDSVFSLDLITEAFRQMASDPLCIAIVGALLVVAGFHIFSHLASIFISKH